MPKLYFALHLQIIGWLRSISCCERIYTYIYIYKKLEISVILEVMLQRLPLPDFDLIFVKSTCFTDLQNPLLRRNYIFKKVKNISKKQNLHRNANFVLPTKTEALLDLPHIYMVILIERT